MSERGNKRNRFLDKYVGVPLTIPAKLFRIIDKLFIKSNKDKQVNSVAVICLGAIGDLLLTTGLINALRNSYPNSRIDLYTTIANSGAAKVIGNVDNKYAFALSKLISMIKTMRKNQYDLLLDTTQWARIGALISAFSKAKTTVGFKTPGQFRSLTYDIAVKHSRNKHEWENFLSLAKAYDENISGAPSILIPNVELPDFGIEGFDLNDKFMVFHMWSTGSRTLEREWSKEKWTALANYYMSKGYKILFSGSPANKAATDDFISEYLQNNLNYGNIAGKVSLEELAVVFSKANAVVAINTGPMHLAALSGTITIDINGPALPLRWGPIGKKAASVSPQNPKKYLHLGFEKVSEDAYTYHIPLKDVIDKLDEMLESQ